MKKGWLKAVMAVFAFMLLLAVGCREDGFRHSPDPVEAADTLRSKDWRPVLIGSSYGYANRDNRLVLPPLYDEAGYFSGGLASVRIGEKTGYIDASGKRVILKSGSDFHDGLAVVVEKADEHVTDADEHWSYINTKGEVVLRTDFYRAHSFSEGLAAVMPDESGGFMFIDKSGNIAIDGEYGYAGDFQEGYAVVMIGQKWGFIDKKGEPLTDFDYDAARDFVEGKAAVLTGDHWGFIDKSGREIIPPQYDDVGPFSEGLAKFKRGGKWGFVDASGNLRIGPEFIYARSFSEGLAAVQDVNGLWGYIDDSGSYRLMPQYEAAFGSENRTMLIKRPGAAEYEYVDQSGNRVYFLYE